jgi:hypothetical protein
MKLNTLRHPTFASLMQQLAEQARRVNVGKSSGALLPDEANSLLHRLKAAKDGLTADKFDGNGKLSSAVAVRDLINVLSHDIRVAKSNDARDVEKGLDALNARISAGRNGGTVTDSEAAKFSNQVKELKLEQNLATTPEAKLAVQKKFLALAKEVRHARRDGDFDAEVRLGKLTDRIQAGNGDGSLTSKEETQLKDQVTALTLLVRTGIKDPDLFNRISANIFRARHDGELVAPKRKDSLTKRLDDAGNSGRLTTEQVASFKAELNELSGTGVVAQGPRLNELKERITAAIAAAREAQTAAAP